MEQDRGCEPFLQSGGWAGHVACAPGRAAPPLQPVKELSAELRRTPEYREGQPPAREYLDADEVLALLSALVQFHLQTEVAALVHEVESLDLVFDCGHGPPGSLGQNSSRREKARGAPINLTC